MFSHEKGRTVIWVLHMALSWAILPLALTVDAAEDDAHNYVQIGLQPYQFLLLVIAIVLVQLLLDLLLRPPGDVYESLEELKGMLKVRPQHTSRARVSCCLQMQALAARCCLLGLCLALPRRRLAALPSRVGSLCSRTTDWLLLADVSRLRPPSTANSRRRRAECRPAGHPWKVTVATP